MKTYYQIDCGGWVRSFDTLGKECIAFSREYKKPIYKIVEYNGKVVSKEIA